LLSARESLAVAVRFNLFAVDVRITCGSDANQAILVAARKPPQLQFVFGGIRMRDLFGRRLQLGVAEKASIHAQASRFCSPMSML